MIRAAAADFIATLRDGVRIWWLAPLIPLLVVIPEAIQHAAEIHIGMFDSRAAALAVADDPRRMLWGYVKVAGLVLAFLASLRFWGAREQGVAWYSPRGVRWGTAALAIALIAATTLPEFLLEGVIPPRVEGAITLAVTLATLPLLALLAGALIGDGAMTLRHAFRRGWLPTVRMVVFAAACWVPLSWLHGMNHRWAMGADPAAVWALMAFDSVVVGLMAVMTGTALHHGYAMTRADRGG